MLRFRGLVTEAFPALEKLDLELGSGEAAVVAGSGRGKFLLFRLVLGLAQRRGGELQVLGSDPQELSRQEALRLRARCGLAPHAGAVISNLSIRANVALPLQYHDTCSDSEINSRVDDALDRLGMARFTNARPAALTLEQQRVVGVARILALRPDVLLLQDPFEGLDEATADRVFEGVQTLLKEGSVALFTTQLTGVDRAYDGKLAHLCGSRIHYHQG